MQEQEVMQLLAHKCRYEIDLILSAVYDVDKILQTHLKIGRELNNDLMMSLGQSLGTRWSGPVS